MMLYGLQIHIRPRVTLTFDLLSPKVDRFMPLPWTMHLCQSVSNLVIVWQQTNGRVENMMLILPAGLTCRRHKTPVQHPALLK